jgi:hypothetical protein
MSDSHMTIADRAGLLLDDPVALAGHSLYNFEHFDRREIDAMQLIGLKRRFAELRDRIPMLKKLADAEGVEHVDNIDDVVPLLFDHTVYKSFPISLLENNRWAQINKWLGKLVVPEFAAALEAADVSHCQGLDDWFEVIDVAVPQMFIGHSSGTSGTISFLPHSRAEAEKSTMVRRMYAWKQTGPDMPRPQMHVVYPFFRHGYYAHVRANEMVIKHIVGGEEFFHAAYPTHMSSDVMFLAARMRAAQAKGTLDRLKISPALLAKKAEFDKLTADMPQHLERFFEKIADELRGKRIFVWATWNLLHNMAKAGLSKGMQNMFAPDSYIGTGGGAKGMVPPPNWQEDVLRFTGVPRLEELYAMTEVRCPHNRCEHGHYHLGPTAITWLLDPETSRPLPREGRQTGRAAFFDLGADSRWGGFITGDEITIEWDKPCDCGRPSAYLVGAISRYSEKNGGDDKISCAASENAHREAMDFLSQLEG